MGCVHPFRFPAFDDFAMGRILLAGLAHRASRSRMEHVGSWIKRKMAE
jgi:hypothetical protein